MREKEREREIDRVWPANPTRPATLTRTDLTIPATSPAKLGIDMKLERWRSNPRYHRRWKTTGTPPFEAQKFTAKNPSPSPSISPEFGHTSSWVLLLTLPASFSGQPCHLKRPDCRRSATWKTLSFGSTIHRHRRAWEVTAGTVGLTEVWTIRPKLSVIVDWSPVTVDRQGQFKGLANENQSEDVVDTESGLRHCEWNIQNLFL